MGGCELGDSIPSVPVTGRGAVVHAARMARTAFRDMRERLELVREIHGAEWEAVQGPGRGICGSDCCGSRAGQKTGPTRRRRNAATTSVSA